MIQVYLSDTETQLGLAKSCHNEKDYATAHFHMKMATVAFAKVIAYLFRLSLHENITAENLYPAVGHLMKYYKDGINIIITKNAGGQSYCDKLESGDSLRELRRTVICIAAEVASAFSALYACAVISLNNGQRIGKKSGHWGHDFFLSEFASLRCYPSSSEKIQYNYLSHLSYACIRLSRLAGYSN